MEGMDAMFAGLTPVIDVTITFPGAVVKADGTVSGNSVTWNYEDVQNTKTLKAVGEATPNGAAPSAAPTTPGETTQTPVATPEPISGDEPAATDTSRDASQSFGKNIIILLGLAGIIIVGIGVGIAIGVKASAQKAAEKAAADAAGAAQAQDAAGDAVTPGTVSPQAPPGAVTPQDGQGEDGRTDI